MTSRLKRRLVEQGVDPASGKANENFCLIGTPLPPLEKSKDTGEFVPLWKQEVRDEKGRRRLHGAFTGGFSAGYFNSVGSKEGWTPSAFVSSRNDRAKAKVARPEDFMDEEDLQEIRDSRKFVDTADEMDLTGGTQAELARREGDEPDSMASALEAAMLPAPKDSAGARILKKMGWKLGQGIGPRVTLRQRKIQDLQAASGYTKIIDPKDVPVDEEEAEKHTYARRDTPVLLVERKDNFHGLGYRPGMRLNEDGKQGNIQTGPNISAGFGLGALNDADEDDLDVYDSGFGKKAGSRTAYDIGSEDDDRIVIGGSSHRPQLQPKSTSTTTFDDGTRVLPGFVLFDKPVLEDRWFPLPDIPKDWTPNPRRVWGSADKENLSVEPSQSSRRLTADQRGSALGETPLPAAPRSVFEYMSEKDRERIKNIASGLTTPSRPATICIPHMDPNIASAALRGFQPFTADPAKQVRYTTYLKSQAEPESGAEALLKPAPGQRVEEFNKELEDYAKAAQIFKPVTGAMAGRFTTAAVIESAPEVREGLHKPSESSGSSVQAEPEKPVEEQLSPKAHAAKMGMYGALTREVTPWQPDRLLCKRFGVKEPTLSLETTTELQSGTKTLLADFVPPPLNPSTTSSADGEPSQGQRDLNNIGLGEDETQGRDTLTYQRPGMEVFKAIFASDDEDSEAGDHAAKDRMDEDEPPAPSIATAPEPKPPDNTPVDLSTFKPTFIPRENRTSSEKEPTEKKKKKKRDKEKKSGLVSFAMDEDGVEAPPETKEPRKKERRKEKKRKDDDDDAMWVEKPPPEKVKDIVMQPVPEQAGLEKDAVVAGPQRGRKRAIDFL